MPEPAVSAKGSLLLREFVCGYIQITIVSASTLMTWNCFVTFHAKAVRFLTGFYT
jgi:hypothetical protein